MYHFNDQPDESIYDVVFLFPKSMQLKEVMEDMKPHIDNETIVVCTMNGLKHEEVIAQYVAHKLSEVLRLGRQVLKALDTVIYLVVDQLK